MSTFNGIAVVSIPATIGGTPSTVASLPWNGTSKPYKWSVSLAVTAQPQSSTAGRQKFTYNGLDINVGMWIANISTGLAWQIISITSKSATSAVCIVQDIFRYNTYRDPLKTGKGTPATGGYVVFKLSDDGSPMVDPAPSGVGANFFSTLTARFQYINEQYDFPLNQPGLTTITFHYGDVIATDENTGAFVLADSTHVNIIGRVTAVDDAGTTFTVNPIRKIVDSLDSLPGGVGSIIYTDLSVPGGITATAGGTEIYLKLRDNTQSTTTGANLSSTTTPITTVSNTFNVNGVLATVSGTGIAQDIVNAINAIQLSTGVSAVLQTTPTINIICTAIDARPINLIDVLGTTVTDAGLVSVENGVKAAGMYITASRKPPAFTQAYGFVFNQVSAVLTWTVVHNANTEEVSARVYGTDNIEVYPDEIEIIDINTVQISFAAPQAGKADLTVFL